MAQADTHRDRSLLTLEGELTIFHAARVHREIVACLEDCRVLNCLDGGRPVTVDLSGIQEMDSAGLQLLLLLRRESRRNEFPLRLTGAPAAVRELVDLYHLAQDLELEDCHGS